jgi:hypothetical protein
MDQHKYLEELRIKLITKEKMLHDLTMEVANLKRQIDLTIEEVSKVDDADPRRARKILWSDFRNMVATHRDLWGYKGRSSKKAKDFCMVSNCSNLAKQGIHELSTFSHGKWKVCGNCLTNKINDCIGLLKDSAMDEKVCFDPYVYPDPKTIKCIEVYLI